MLRKKLVQEPGLQVLVLVLPVMSSTTRAIHLTCWHTGFFTYSLVKTSSGEMVAGINESISTILLSIRFGFHN